MAQLQEWLDTLISTDFYLIVVPFILTFAIIYGLLAKANLFGGKNDQVSAIIALVAGFLVVRYQPIASQDGVNFLVNTFGAVSAALVVLTLVLIGAALFGVTSDDGEYGKYLKYLGFVVMAGILALALYWGAWEAVLAQAGPGVPGVPGLPAVDVVTALVLLLGVGAIVFMLRGGGGDGG